MDLDYLPYSDGDANKRAPTKKVLSLAERIAVIHQAKNTPKPNILANLAGMFDCGRTQIANILANQDSLLQEWEESPDPDFIRRRRNDFSGAIAKMVFEWVKRAAARRICLNDVMLKTQATLAQELTGFTHFKASKRWLDRFKAKHQMNYEPIKYNPGDEAKELTMTAVASDLYFANEISPIVHAAIQKNVKNPVSPPTVKSRKRRSDTALKTYTKKLPKTEGEEVEEGCDGGSSVKSEPYPSSSEEVEILPDIIPQHANDDSDDQSPESNDDSNFDYFESGQSSESPPFLKPTQPAITSTPKQTLAQAPIPLSPKLTPTPSTSNGKELSDYQSAISYLGPLEDFVLMKEDFRAIGLINQLESIFKEAMKKMKNE